MADEVVRPVTRIEHKEGLYRRVPEDRIKWEDSGQPVFSARIFRDRYCRPSVYRADLCVAPEAVKHHGDDGVLVLTAEAVREIEPVKRFRKGEVLEEEHSVDVEHVPEGDPPTVDYAHSEIFLVPNTEHGATCHRLYEALALKAANAWAVRPARLR